MPTSRAAVLCLALAACGTSAAPGPSPSASPTDHGDTAVGGQRGPGAAASGAATASGASASSSRAPAEAPPPGDPNPLHLPARRLALDPGKRVFAPSDLMLATAKPGSSLVLYAATALGLDGDDVIIEGRGGPPYKVHAGYVIPVPDDAKVRPGDAVVTEHGGVLKHAVVTKLAKDKTLVRFTDLDARAHEVALKHARFLRQVDGLAAGSYAAWHDGDTWRHVLLVSPFTEGGVKKWLALGFAGAAQKVDEAQLKPIPVRFNPKVGATVWAESVGAMRRAVVVTADEQGVFTVKFERAGRPAVVGWGLAMQPLD
ncbi:MAG TPA: hypothetical protein VGM56_19090 [Byssovorax sp.]|jgi:hypothetical protein